MTLLHPSAGISGCLMFGALKSFHTVCMDLVKVSPKQMVKEAGTKFRLNFAEDEFMAI